MAKFLKASIIFFISVIILIIGSSIALLKVNGPLAFLHLNKLPYKGYGKLYERIQEADTTKDVDILVLGSSHAYRGFDPRIFAQAGYRMFNFGSSNQTHLQTKFVLEQYLETLRPKLVIYEVLPEIFSLNGNEAWYDWIANYEQTGDVLRYLRYDINKLKAIYAKQLVSRAATKEFEVLQDPEDEYIKGGYVEKHTNSVLKENTVRPHKIEMRKEQKAAFLENIELLKSKGIKVLLIEAPIPQVYYKAIENHQEFEEFFKRIGTYINGNTLGLALEDSVHFYDNNHLTQEGVEIFCSDMIHHVDSSGIISKP